jgi:succinoglycan biosynthesis transport protein ExoP
MYSLPAPHMTPSPPPPTHNGNVLCREPEADNLRDYWIVIRKYRWTIVTFMLLISLIAGVSVVGKPRVYSAVATLYFENPPSNLTGSLEAAVLAEKAFAAYYATQLDLLKSRSLVARVIQDIGLDQGQRFQAEVLGPPSWGDHLRRSLRSAVRWVRDSSVVKWLQERFTAVREAQETHTEVFEVGVHPDLIDGYIKKLEITHSEESQLAKVHFSTLVPALSRDIVNAHATTFIRTDLQTRFQETAEAQQFLEAKLSELKIALEQSEADLTRFRKTHAIVTMEQGQNLVLERLRALNADLTQARSKRIELESIVRAVQKRDNQALSQVIDNPLIQKSKEQIVALETERARLATTFRAHHPQVAALQEQINEAKARMEQEIHRVVLSITLDYNAAKAKEQALADAMEAQRRAAMDLRANAVEASILEGEVEANRRLYDNILKRTKETGLARVGPTSNIRVVDRADLPIRPDDTKATRTLLLSVVVGLFGGVGMAFLRHYADNTLKTPADIGRFIHLPTLGMVPDSTRLEKQMVNLAYILKGSLTRNSMKGLTGETAGLVIANHPLSVIRESYQAICTALRFCLPERPPRTILITSSQPQEGKTATAVNIAITLARGGVPVLLIDADLRNGHCHRLLGLENEDGLTNALTGDTNIRELIKTTAVTNLFLLARGTIPPNPAALVGSERMQQILNSLATDFSFIIIDSAPLLPISDSVLLSTKVDGVLLVARAQEVSRYVVGQACERLAYVKAKVLGVILNGIDIQSPEYRDYKSSYMSYYAGYAIDRR